jgi:hypothetical protein
MQWANNQRLSLTVDPGIGDFVARMDPHIVGSRYLIKTAWASENNAFFVDKHPMNFIWCAAILKAIPHAKILHLRRHPLDSCFSNLKELFAHKYYPYSYALDELATHYRNYSRLMRHFHDIAPGRILDVRYEDLASQPDVEARRVQRPRALVVRQRGRDGVAEERHPGPRRARTGGCRGGDGGRDDHGEEDGQAAHRGTLPRAPGRRYGPPSFGSGSAPVSGMPARVRMRRSPPSSSLVNVFVAQLRFSRHFLRYSEAICGLTAA